ncbi:MAG: hypothetical protein ABI833_13635 [Acidobacteriota bacterium]
MTNTRRGGDGIDRSPYLAEAASARQNRRGASELSLLHPSRVALTVGFIATMVFSIGQRVLPAVGGARVLYSPGLMFASLAKLTLGCASRVSSEIPAYEGYSQIAWRVLPCSAVIELRAVSLFAVNLLATFARPPAHLRNVTAVS